MPLASQCRNVFLRPNGGRRLIFQPSEEQVDCLCHFLLVPSPEEDGPSSPFPLLPEKYARRVDPWEAFKSLHIFRNRYERKLTECRPREHMVALEDDLVARDLLKVIKERYG